MKSYSKFFAAAALLFATSGLAQAQTLINFDFGIYPSTVPTVTPQSWLGTPGGSISATSWQILTSSPADNTGTTLGTVVTVGPTANTFPLGPVGTTFTLSWVAAGNTFSDTLTENLFAGGPTVGGGNAIVMDATGTVTCSAGPGCGNFLSAPSNFILTANQSGNAISASITYSAAPGPIPGAGLLSYLALGIVGLGSIGVKRLRRRAAAAA